MDAFLVGYLVMWLIIFMASWFVIGFSVDSMDRYIPWWVFVVYVMASVVHLGCLLIDTSPAAMWRKAQADVDVSIIEKAKRKAQAGDITLAEEGDA